MRAVRRFIDGGGSIMKKPPLRKHAEILRAHDLLGCLLAAKQVPTPLHGALNCAADCLCWTLNHDENRSFGHLLEQLERVAVSCGVTPVIQRKPPNSSHEMRGVMVDPDDLVSEWRVASFLGAYAFWEALRRNSLPPAASERGEEVIRLLGKTAFHHRKGLAHSAKEAEAFRYCGLDPVEHAAKEKMKS
jgi:hypothetical protein